MAQARKGEMSSRAALAGRKQAVAALDSIFLETIPERGLAHGPIMIVESHPSRRDGATGRGRTSVSPLRIEPADAVIATDGHLLPGSRELLDLSQIGFHAYC
jgi:hypothetical protein